MFFDMDLLCCQRQGKFGLIWLAATRGIATMKRREVEAVNITITCNDLLKFIMSHSTSPKKRLSLYLSAKLLFGTVLIYKQQVVNFEHTIVTFFCSIKRPLIISDCDDEPKVRKKTTTGRKGSNRLEIVAATEAEQIRGYADVYEQVLPEINVNVTDPIHITLPDGDVGISVERGPNLFGDEGQIDQQLSQLCGDNWINIPDAPVPTAITDLQPMTLVPAIEQAPEPIHIHDILPAPDTSSGKSKRLVSSPEESPSKRKRMVAQSETSTTSSPQLAAVAEVVQAQVHQQDEPRTPRPDVRPDNEQIEMPPPRRRPPPVRRIFPNVARNRIDIDIVSPRRWQRTRLDRPVVAMETIIGSPAQRAAQANDPKDIIALILAGVQYDNSDVMSIVRGAQENVSSESGRINLTVTDNTLGRTIEPIAEHDIQIQEELPTLPELNAMQVDNIAINPVPSPRFSNILRENEEELNVSDMPPPRMHASTPKSNGVTFETAFTRQNNLLERIRALFLENGNSALQLEQLCDVQIRSTISNTFYDLLYLHSKQYIRMECVPGTIQLGAIQPGEKLHS